MSVGGVQWRPFLLVAGTGGAAAICVAVCIFAGALKVTIAGNHPIGMAAEGGTAETLSVGMGTDVAAIGLSGTSKARPSMKVAVTHARLESLCLAPQFGVPLFDSLWSIQLSSDETVEIGSATLATGDATVDIDTGATTIGSPLDKGGRRSSFGITTGSQTEGLVSLGDLDLPAYGVQVADGLSLKSLAVALHWGNERC